MKFKTLTHNGPLYPKAYEPKNYEFNNEKLSPLAEQMLWHYSAKLDTDYVKNATFNKNFWSCLKLELTKNQIATFPDSYKALLQKMHMDQAAAKEAKKLLNTKEARALKKAENEKIKAQYGWAEIDGKKQPIANYMIEPAGIMCSRGKSPMLGFWKYEVQPEDVTINYIGPEAGVPKAPAGHQWKAVVQNNDAFVATYFDCNVGNYVVLHKKFGMGTLSDVKQNADIKKFDKAQKLCAEWDKISAWVDKGLSAKDPKMQQSALISWLILQTGIRVGVEHQKIFENGTCGASSLLVKNVTFNGNEMTLDFIGKDSVHFSNKYDVPEAVRLGIQNCQKDKAATDKIFDKANEGTVNAFLAMSVPYCTAKLFRTAYGTKLLAEELQKHPLQKGCPNYVAKATYDNACLAVSIKLNHQKNVAKNYGKQIENTDDKINEAKEALIKRNDVAKKALKKVQADIKAANATFDGDKLAKKLETLKAKKDRIAAQIERAEQRVEKLKFNKDLKKATKTISLGTARNAYSSPKICFSWCADNDVDISVVYNKTLSAKFAWAANTPKSYWKKYPNV